MYHIVKNQKGRCLISSKHIPKNTIIIKEKPSIICEDAYDCVYQLYNSFQLKFANSDDNIYNEDLKYAILIADYEEIIPHSIDEYTIEYSQIKEHIQTLPIYMRDFFETFNKNKLRILLSKFHRNAFTYDNFHGGTSAILFIGNILNHSCDPNIEFFIDKNGFFIFKTKRAVKKGEELCNSYIDINLSIKKRKTLLLEQYAFNCECDKCMAKNNCLSCC